MAGITVTLDAGRTYKWFGNFGSILVSNEKGVKIGDCRIINDILFYACYVRRTWSLRYKEVSWSVQDVNMEKIREIQKKLLRY